MQATPKELLSFVPECLHEQVLLYWQDWLSTCDKKNLNHTIDYDIGRVGRIWACSDFVARSCIRYPDVLAELLDDIDDSRSFSDYQYIVNNVLDIKYDEAEVMRLLRQLRQKEMLRIAWRDLDELTPQKQILNELSDFAQAMIAGTLQCLHLERTTVFGNPVDENSQPMHMLVLAMGKLGGRELNFSSDIDLIFCYPQDGETEGPRKQSNHEFFVRLAQSLVKLLNEVTNDGFVYRVDTRLRPYGDSGPLVSSFSAIESYYQHQGRDWERYAMIKANIITGSDEDREYLRSMLKPFVYRRYLDYSAFESIREMKSMINAEVKRKGIENNIKLGRGGIREIEFIGQTFQMIRGGRDTQLQERSIMAILSILADMKLLKNTDVNNLKDAYVFHRKLENRLQMERDLQTHSLPDDALYQQKMTLAMNADSWDVLSVETESHRSNVDKIFQDILFAEETSHLDDNELNALWFSHDSENNIDALFSEWLKKNGIIEYEAITALFNRFRKNSHIKSLSEVASKRLVKLLSGILAKLDSVNEQAIVLERVLEVLSAIVGRQVYINLLLEYPQVLDLVIFLCSCSDWFAKQLGSYPVLLDELINSEYLHAISHRKDLVIELDYLLSGVKSDDLEQQMERLRYFKQAQVLKVAALDVKNKIDVKEVAHTLSNVAEVICQKALTLVWDVLVKKYGAPECVVDGSVRKASMGIVAYGKLGGDELGYGSDLDVVFLHNSKGEKQMTAGGENGKNGIDNMTFFVRAAQKIIHIMETYMHGGRLYEIDTRLRPDGRAGLMAIGMRAFEQYQMEKAWTWEHQALIRARMVAGDEPIRQEFDRIRLSVLQQAQSCEKIISDVVEMREKMREHLANKDDSVFNIKQDVGGLVDIEFIAQAGVLCSASKASQLLETTSTLLLLEQLPDCDWLSQDEADVLITAYQDYRLAVNRQALVIDDFNQTNQQLSEKLKQHRIQVTQIWNRIMKND